MPLGAFKAALMGTAGVSTAGDVVLLSSQTASDSANLDFTSGIDSTYGEYIFRFYNINPATDGANFTFNCSIDGGSNYNVTKTTTVFRSQHAEADDAASLAYTTGWDLAQSADFQLLMSEVGNDSDESGAGIIHLFNPSSTTYVKHFYSRFIENQGENDRAFDLFIAGYFNDTNDIDAIQFKMSSGNFDGTIKMWGVK